MGERAEGDFLLVAAVFVIGIGLPYIHFGGVGPMFDALALARPRHLVMPGATSNLGHSWYVSAVLLSSLSFTWPHIFGSAFTAKSGDTLRWNAVFMPFYVIPLMLIIFAGCAAILVVPNLANGDLALLMVVRRTFPPWILGVIGGAGALTAMVPAAIQILTASTLLAKNLCRPIFAPAMTDPQVARLARIAVMAITAIALVLAMNSSTTLVGLLLIAYAGTGQFFPGIDARPVLASRDDLRGIFTGLAAGLALAAFLISTPPGDLGFRRAPIAGFVALVANSGLAVAVSFLTAPQPSGFDQKCA